MAEPGIPIEIARDEFARSRPVVSRGLVLNLWRQWQAIAPDAWLFDDPTQNLALLLHARAHGAPVPQPGDRSTQGRLLRDMEHLYEPVAPAPLIWGPRANLCSATSPAIESPILDVWIYRDGALPSGVLIIGDALPEIRAQVLPAAFLASLGMGTLDTDMVNNGAIRVELPLSGRPALKIPVNLLGAHPGFLPADVPDNARDAIQQLVRELRDLATATGLIRLHETEADTPARLHQAILDRASRAAAHPVLWASVASEPSADMAALVPYVEIPDGSALQMRFSGTLLDAPAYQKLERIYRRATIERIKTDVTLRRDRNTQEAERLDRDHEAYKNTPKESRVAIWGPTVLLDVRYDPRLDREIHVEPKEEDAEKYYLHAVPGLANNHRKTAELMGRILDSIVAADERPDAPVRRLAAARLLDAAVRGGNVTDSPSLTAAFDTWAAQVRPMLWLEWRKTLTDAGIQSADVFTHNTIVHIGQSDGEWGRDLLMVPHSVMHPRGTAALVDRRRRVTVYLDTARTARALDQPNDPAQAEDAWRRVVELATVPGTIEADVDLAVNDALLADPAKAVRRVLDTLTDAGADSDSAATPARSSPEGRGAFDAALEKAIEATSRLRAMRRAGVALSRWAPQTVRASVAAVGTENPWLGVRAALLEAALEYLHEGGDPRSPAELAAGIGPGGTERVMAALHRAREQNSEYTEQWLAQLKAVDLGAAVSRLQLGVPPLERLLTDDEARAAWMSRVGAETARLARLIEEAADTLAEDGEPIPVALAKLGAALEESFLDEFAGANRHAAHDLMAILTGTERSFGQGTRPPNRDDGE
ncbi:MAG TPA: hypothetical protein VFB74_27350 [Kribbellaceae bacterium]|nr:hypothetical protein [Kribbellaceae bacterium]